MVNDYVTSESRLEIEDLEKKVGDAENKASNYKSVVHIQNKQERKLLEEKELYKKAI